jgi:hypothetical protein
MIEKILMLLLKVGWKVGAMCVNDFLKSFSMSFFLIYNLSGMSKSGFLGRFWRPDLRHLELIFWDETWHTSSLGQNLDPIFFFGLQPLWNLLYRRLKAQLGSQILSYWKEFYKGKNVQIVLQKFTCILPHDPLKSHASKSHKIIPNKTEI